MPSPLRYRVWRVPEQKMYYFGSPLVTRDTQGDRQLVFREDDGRPWNEDCTDDRFENPAECIVMQSTGLTDKNGREIYEGDVIEVHYEDVKGNNHTVACCVEYRDGEWIAVKPKDYWWSLNDVVFWTLRKGGWTNAHNITSVIGNLHENPDLLPQAA